MACTDQCTDEQVYECTTPYTANTRTLRQSVRSGRDSVMSEKSDFFVVIPTPIGVVALSKDELRKARRTAENLLDDSIPTRNQEEVAHFTTLMNARAIAESFDMDAKWFLTRAREGRLPHVRLGRYVRFDPDEVRTFFQRNPDRHANSQITHHR